MRAEKTKLKELEARRKEIEGRMRGEKIGSKKGEIKGVGEEVEKGLVSEGVSGERVGGEMEGVWRDAKEEEDAQRAVLENIEFQLLEVRN